MAPLARVESGKRCVVLQGRPDFRRWREDILESARHHADHGEEPVVERDPPSDDGRVSAETPAPQAIAQYRDVSTARPIFTRVDGTSEYWRHREDAEVVGAHALSIETFRLRGADQRWLPVFERGERFERPGTDGELPERSERHRGSRAVAASIPNRQDSTRVRIRKPLEE